MPMRPNSDLDQLVAGRIVRQRPQPAVLASPWIVHLYTSNCTVKNTASRFHAIRARCVCSERSAQLTPEHR